MNGAVGYETRFALYISLTLYIFFPGQEENQHKVGVSVVSLPWRRQGHAKPPTLPTDAFSTPCSLLLLIT